MRGAVEGGGALLRGKGREGRVLRGVNRAHTHHPSVRSAAGIHAMDTSYVAMDTSPVTMDTYLGVDPRCDVGGGWDRGGEGGEGEGAGSGGFDIDWCIHRVPPGLMGRVWGVRGEGRGVGGGGVGGEGGVRGRLGEGRGVPHHLVGIGSVLVILHHRRGQNKPTTVPVGSPVSHGNGDGDEGRGGAGMGGGEDGGERDGVSAILLVLGFFGSLS